MSTSLGLTGGRALPTATDEVEIVTPELCELCSTSLAGLRLHQKQEHYDKHFDDKPAKPASTSAKTKSPQTKSPQNKRKPFISKDMFSFDDTLWLNTFDSPPPSNQHPGFIPLLKKALLSSHEKGYTRRAFLCYPKTVYVTVQSSDRMWGCGYRNYMTACSALMGQSFQPMYFPLLDSNGPPGIRELQRSIETAWNQGYDEVGAKQLGRKLLNSGKWIGTADIWVAYSHKGVLAQLVDFYCKESSRGSQLVTDWIVEYFSAKDDTSHPSTVNEALLGATAVTCTDKMPLILQHHGHSRTVVGYEITKNGSFNLLIFDPSSIPNKDLRQAALETHRAQQSGVQSANSAKTPQGNHGIRDFLKNVPKAFSGHKRTADQIDLAEDGPSGPKRSRSDSDDDEVIIVEEAPSSRSKQPPSPTKKSSSHAEILKHCRVDSQKLGKKDEYQILSFPLTDPLSDEQRLLKKTVTSIRLP